MSQQESGSHRPTPPKYLSVWNGNVQPDDRNWWARLSVVGRAPAMIIRERQRYKFLRLSSQPDRESRPAFPSLSEAKDYYDQAMRDSGYTLIDSRPPTSLRTAGPWTQKQDGTWLRSGEPGIPAAVVTSGRSPESCRVFIPHQLLLDPDTERHEAEDATEARRLADRLLLLDRWTLEGAHSQP